MKIIIEYEGKRGELDIDKEEYTGTMPTSDFAAILIYAPKEIVRSANKHCLKNIIDKHCKRSLGANKA